MHIVLHPRAAPPDRLRFWVGVFETRSRPALRFTINGVRRTPTALREVASVRPPEQLAAGSNPTRTWTGVYEFDALHAASPHHITVSGRGVRAEMRFRTLPERLPDEFEQSFNILLVSCFHQQEDRAGLAGRIVSRLPSALRPHLSLLMGDQVYLDLPTLQNFPDDLPWLAEKFERDYVKNLKGAPGYAQVLDAAPSAAIPDDHEFWNNYPHVSPFIGNSHSAGGRARWRSAAMTAYEGFQLGYPAASGEPQIYTIEPLSIFVADLRSLRDPDRAFLMTEGAHQRFEQWVTEVIQNGWYPAFVSGQSMFTEAAGSIAGKVGDYELPNYGDYDRIARQLRRFADAGIPTLCLTGDVHWGRILESVDARTQQKSFYEIISSPSSLVTTVGSDQFSAVKAFFVGLFSDPPPWPRHSDPASPPEYFAQDALSKRFRNRPLYGHRGNHVVLLQCKRFAGGIKVKPSYWPLSDDSEQNQPRRLPVIQLVRR
ncbi:hypothetical protein KQI65_08320 [bacterium]|nr:hypothetical protein [bacterium]